MTLEEYKLYELTKPSFIQNVNFSTEAKHRDPVETLVQGRNGISERGGEPPKNILVDGKYKYDITRGAKRFFAACTVVSGRVYVYAESLDEVDNINVYLPTGAIQARNGADTIVQAIRSICETYDNFVDVTKEVQLDEQIADFDTYLEL